MSSKREKSKYYEGFQLLKLSVKNSFCKLYFNLFPGNSRQGDCSTTQRQLPCEDTQQMCVDLPTSGSEEKMEIESYCLSAFSWPQPDVWNPEGKVVTVPLLDLLHWSCHYKPGCLSEGRTSAFQTCGNCAVYCILISICFPLLSKLKSKKKKCLFHCTH